MSYSRKKQAARGGHTFVKTPLEFFIFLLDPWKFQTNQSSTAGNCAKLCYISLVNSKTKKQDPWKFHIIISWSPLEIPHAISLIPLEIPCRQPPSLFEFFLK